jgi:hypothetical protein
VVTGVVTAAEAAATGAEAVTAGADASNAGPAGEDNIAADGPAMDTPAVTDIRGGRN